ncbi:MAG: DUF167 family protein [Brevundimonas sp.]
MGRLTVRLTPRGGADRMDGWDMDAEGRPVLKARVRSAPTEGQANAALIRLMARALAVPKSRVALARGAASRVKTLEIEGLSDAEIRARLDLHGEGENSGFSCPS